jgi:ATP-binding cassette subfamily B (MDR/TAP) protein 1
MPEQLVLDGANFFFPAGELTFVMGRSGSGKSTLANLLLQFYHPASGEILIDGESTRGLDTNWLRNNITLVQQDNVLFNETIFENIALGRHDQERVSLEEVNACVDAAKLEDTLHNLSDGLHTRVGMNGSHLSGGQRQRIAIARARLRDTPVLILDEATSALDQASRMVIMESIREWRNGKTTIVITHDTSQIQDGEYVYILDKGQVIQEGYRNSLQDETGSQLEVLLHLGPVLQSPRPQSPTETEQRRSLILPSTIENTVEDWLRQSCHFEDPIATQIPIQETFLLSPDTVAPGDLRSQRYTTDVLAMFSAMASSADQGSTPRMSTIPLIPKRPDRIYHTSGIELDDLEPAWEKSMRQTFSTVKPPRVVSQQPALKNVKITKPSRLQVCLSFLGISRVASKSERPLASLASILSTVWPRLSRHQRLLLVLGFTAASIHAAATPVFSWVFANLLGTFYLSSGQVQQALIWSLSILAVALADASASYFMHYFLEMTGQAWVDSLRIEALKRILDQPKSWFDLDDNNLSMIAECLDRNAEEMRNLVGRFTGFAYVAATMLIISIFWSMAVCWKLTLVGLVTAPVIYGITKGFEAVSGKWESKRNDVGEAIGAIFHETFINISTVRALAVEDYFHKRLAAATRQALNGGLKRATFSGIFFGLADSSIIFATALIFYYGSVLAASGAWSAQDILTVFSLLLFGIANVNAVVGYIPQVNSSRDTASRLLRLASLPLGSSDEYTGTLRLSYLPGPLRFASITSTYPLRPALPVLDSLTLDIPLSSSTAIVGPSGCGKSTIVSLLLRLYPVDPSTALTVGSTPISELHLPSWRDLVAAVFQKSTIFPATIAENIAYPQSRLTEHGKMESIVGAASLAGIHTFIESLPLGYNTPIGDGGTGLSGGQVQRIGIARALIRKPQLLIMDEPTSALDSESAEGVRGVIADLVRQGVTVVVMTHSWEMMKVCGRVVVLGNGKVVEQGIYDELMRKSAGPLKDLLGGEGSGVQALEEVIEQD